MIDVTIRNYLINGLQDAGLNVPVLFEKPKNKTIPYIILHEIDSGITNQISAITFAVTIISDSMYNAKVLSTTVKSLLLDAISLPEVSKASLGGSNSRAVASESAYEYELIFNFHYFEEE